ncbi:MAG: hypothetical protein K2X81_04460 [Candidatus Obscuribacterales bacterium]|nr:hypothetical protein [Candidatus Obscuribacterales bacterium]
MGAQDRDITPAIDNVAVGPREVESGPTSFTSIMADAPLAVASGIRATNLGDIDFSKFGIAGYDKDLTVADRTISQSSPQEYQNGLREDATERNNPERVTNPRNQLQEGDIISLQTPGKPTVFAEVVKDRQGQLLVVDHPTDTSRDVPVENFARRLDPKTTVTRYAQKEKV